MCCVKSTNRCTKPGFEAVANLFFQCDQCGSRPRPHFHALHLPAHDDLQMTAVLTPERVPETETVMQANVSPSDDLIERARFRWLLLLWSVCVFPFSVNVVDPDLWGHVQYGQDWISEGALPRFSSHNFTAIGHPWINHENLSELFLAIGFERLGVLGMSLLKFSAGIGMLFLAWRHARKQSVTIGTFLIVAGMVAYALHPFWLFRPQMATWLGLAAMVCLLNAAFRDWHDESDHPIRWGYLLVLGPLFVVWTNAHGGFLAGLCMLGAYLFGRCVELFSSKDPNAAASALSLAITGLAIGALTLLNPYGIELHQWLVHSLGEARPEIIEWHRPTILAPVFAPFFALLLVSLLAWIASARKRDWTHGLVLLVTMAQALLHIRHIALFAILALFWMPLHVGSLKENCFSDVQQRIKTWVQNRGVVFLRLVIFSSVFITPLNGVIHGRRMALLPVKSDTYPLQAIQFMHDNDIHGRLVVSFNWAQYAIAALQPKTKVSFDGRFRTCYPQHIIDKHFDLMVGNVLDVRNRASNTVFDPTAILREGDPDLVLLDRKQFPHSVEVLNKQPEFTLLYEDTVAQLWGRRSRFKDVETIRGYDEYYPARYLPYTKIELIGSSVRKLWPAIPKRRAPFRYRLPALTK